MKLASNIKHYLIYRYNRLKKIKSPVKFVMLLHFNQNFVPYLDFVALGFYNRLISILRKFPHIPVVIHISGTALSGIQWFNPSLVELIRQGVKSGQFQLAESLYSQAIPYSISKEEIDLNIELHRNILKEIFGEYESGIFWNPERIWHPSLLEVFENEEIKYSFMEDEVIRKNLGNEHIYSPLIHEGNKNSTIILPDSNNMRVTLNNYLLTGKLYTVESLFRSIASKSGDNVIVYAEDAEAFGLWEFEKNQNADIDSVFNNLIDFLKWIDSSDYIKPSGINEISGNKSAIPLSHFDQEQSSWLKRALSHENEKYHEKGFKDWFDYNLRSDKLKIYRDIQKETGQIIESDLKQNSYLPSYDLKKMSKLVELTKFLYAHHLYEFGCPGLIYGDDNYLERIRISQIPPYLLKEYQKGEWCFKTFDVNNDGKDEIIIIHYNFTLVLNSEGHIEYLFEMKTGIELTGGHIPGYILEKKDSEDYSDLMFNNPLWNWIKDYDLGHFGIKKYALRRFKFVEHFSIDGSSEEKIMFKHISRISPIYILLFSTKSNDIYFQKEYDCTNNCIIIRYRIHNETKSRINLNFTIDTGFAPDYLNVLKNGRRALNYYSNSGDESAETPFSFRKNGIGIMNNSVNKGVHVKFEKELPDNINTYDGLHNLCFKAVYKFSLDENKEVNFSLKCFFEDL